MSLQVLTPQPWSEYELLDSGNGQKLERFGKYILVRPDPQIIWRPHLPEAQWAEADAIFKRTSEDKGSWQKKKEMPRHWEMNYKDITLLAKLSPFKHTGIFPEQAIHWDWITEKIANAGRQVNILNLFGYTGISSLVAAAAGAKVTHVDASYPTIGWARENQKLSELEDKPVRWILDDALKYTERELKRGVKYDGILMDPPIYGHGPEGERWKFQIHFPELLSICRKIFSDQPLFIIVNAYAISASALMLQNVLQGVVQGLSGSVEAGELALPEKDTSRLLSTGIFARWAVAEKAQ